MTETVLTIAAGAEARWPTAMPARYMGQLCKHFAHRLRVTLNEKDGSIDFDTGRCVLQAESDVLVMRVEAVSEAELPRLQRVVLSHLQRFAFREMTEADLAAIAWVKA
ncbi:DUF2218 domain-containing protein [Acidisoma cellulosilytica]|uniref:DUF2218 domain-containing protein n=1 Tax=Acidisoma cellulosilyticum TaxID=2802395 RepID=A0A963Z0A5_9PROT|nr:DUF2218 domain-containing protein [Acidisoma cellulosilyticum]MCB8880438.1 DUF2218 domain-containing protein [Acidisoma cellulosilyticum]